MANSKIYYKRAIGLGQIALLPFYWLLQFSIYMQLTEKKEHFDGFLIVDSFWNNPNAIAFFKYIKAALRLIRSQDQRRFRTVQREIKTIINVFKLGPIGNYLAPIRACALDFCYFPLPQNSDQREIYVVFWASVIVHEATHGRLMSLNIPYNKLTRSRVERICCNETRHFVLRVESLKPEWYGLADELAPKFDQARWEEYWNSKAIRRWFRAGIKQQRSN